MNRSGIGVTLLTIVLPLALAVVLATWRLGAANQELATLEDVAAAELVSGTYAADRRLDDRRGGWSGAPHEAGGGSAPDRFHMSASVVHYDAALYHGDVQVAASAPGFGPARLPRDWLAPDGTGGPVELEDGRAGALALSPGPDGTEETILVGRRAPEPLSLPRGALALGALAWSLTLLIALLRLRRPSSDRPPSAVIGAGGPRQDAGIMFPRRGTHWTTGPDDGPAGGVELFLWTLVTLAPGILFALYLFGVEGAAHRGSPGGFRLWVAGIFGTWALVAAAGPVLFGRPAPAEDEARTEAVHT